MKKDPLKSQTIHLFTLVAVFLTLAHYSSTHQFYHHKLLSYSDFLPRGLNSSIIAGYYLRLAAEQNFMQRFLLRENFWFGTLSFLESPKLAFINCTFFIFLQSRGQHSRVKCTFFIRRQVSAHGMILECQGMSMICVFNVNQLSLLIGSACIFIFPLWFWV